MKRAIRLLFSMRYVKINEARLRIQFVNYSSIVMNEFSKNEILLSLYNNNK
jgi:hypothetical protein